MLEPGCTLAIRPGYQHTVTAEPAAVGEAAAEGGAACVGVGVASSQLRGTAGRRGHSGTLASVSMGYPEFGPTWHLEIPLSLFTG